MGTKPKSGISLVVAVVAWGVFLALVWCSEHRAHAEHYPYFFAYLALAAFYWISVLVTGSANPFHIVMGADGRLSTSKFQFFVWTGVVVFVYVLIFFSIDNSHREILNRFPPNVLLVMGFSVATAVGAKGITVSYLNSGQIAKPASTQAGGDASLSGLVTHDDSNTPDLTKLQMLIWMAIATSVYLYKVYQSLHDHSSCFFASPLADTCKFPDIDQSLMVLMGISQGAYLGNKLVAAGVSQAIGLFPAVGIPGTDVTISGQSLGTTQGGNVILINGQDARITATSWTDAAVHFTVPKKRADGTAWVPGEQVTVAVIINGQQTTNMAFAFAAQPVITSVSPLKAQSQVTISGRNFGAAKQPGSKLLLNHNDSTSLVNGWTDGQVQFKLENTLPGPGGAAWQTGIVFNVQIALADGFASDPVQVTTT